MTTHTAARNAAGADRRPVADNPLGYRFGNVVRASRRARRWSQEALAEKADLNRSYLGEIERGLAIPSLVTVVKLADAFELSPSALLARCESGTTR